MAVQQRVIANPIAMLVRTSHMTKKTVSVVPKEHTTIKLVSPVALIVPPENTTIKRVVRKRVLALIVPQENTTIKRVVRKRVLALIVPPENTTTKLAVVLAKIVESRSIAQTEIHHVFTSVVQKANSYTERRFVRTMLTVTNVFHHRKPHVSIFLMTFLRLIIRTVVF